MTDKNEKPAPKDGGTKANEDQRKNWEKHSKKTNCK